MSADSARDRYGGAYERMRNIFHLPSSTSARYMVIGCNRMGANVVCQLAEETLGMHGDGHVWIMDGERVEPANTRGTPFALRHVGMWKAEAAAQLIDEKRPRTDDELTPVTCITQHVTRTDVAWLVEHVQRHGIAVVGLFFDDFPLLLDIADALYPHVPCVAAPIGERASFAEVAFSVPQATPTVRQLLGNRARATIEGATALGCDVKRIAMDVTSLMARLLMHGRKGADWCLPAFIEAPLIVIGLRQEWVFAGSDSTLVRSVRLVSLRKGTTP